MSLTSALYAWIIFQRRWVEDVHTLTIHTGTNTVVCTSNFTGNYSEKVVNIIFESSLVWTLQTVISNWINKLTEHCCEIQSVLVNNQIEVQISILPVHCRVVQCSVGVWLASYGSMGTFSTTDFQIGSQVNYFFSLFLLFSLCE